MLYRKGFTVALLQWGLNPAKEWMACNATLLQYTDTSIEVGELTSVKLKKWNGKRLRSISASPI